MSKKFVELMNATRDIEATTGSNPSDRLSQNPKTATGQSIGAIIQRDAALDRADKAEAELASVRAEMYIALDLLEEVPGRRRQLSPDEYSELKNNLRQHPLATPITVRRVQAGRYEIVSGHNRVAIYAELRSEDPEKFATIKAWVDDSDAKRTEELAFYANLMHPDLPDYEKYLGFKKIMLLYPDELKTPSDLSNRTGISRRMISKIMSLDDLPKEALALIAKHPKGLGGNALEPMAAAAREGRSQEVIEAIRLVVEEGLDQHKAIEMVKAGAQPALATQKKTQTNNRPVPVEYKVGRTLFCRYVRVDKRIALSFKTEEDAAEVEAAVQAVLEQQAAQRNAKKK